MRRPIAVILATLLIAYVVFVQVDSKLKTKNKLQHKTPIEYSVPKQHPEESIPSNKIMPSAKFTTRVIYRDTGKEEVTSGKVNNDLVGMTKEQIAQIYPGWKIRKFNDKEVELVLAIDDPDQMYQKAMYLGIKDGHIAVFYGKPGQNSVLKEITKVPLAAVPEQDAADLQEGIVVKNDKEILEIIEGFME